MLSCCRFNKRKSVSTLFKASNVPQRYEIWLSCFVVRPCDLRQECNTSYTDEFTHLHRNEFNETFTNVFVNDVGAIWAEGGVSSM